MQFHAQLFQDSAGRVHDGSCLCCRFTGNHPIVGIPRQLIPSQPHLPIKGRQENVTEDGRNHSSLRSATLTGKELSFAVASRLEHRFNQAKHSAIRYLLGYQCEKLFVINGPEKVSEVRVHDPLRSTLDFFPDFAQRILRRSPSPIPKAGIIEYRLKDRPQPIEQRLLTHTVLELLLMAMTWVWAEPGVRLCQLNLQTLVLVQQHAL